MSVRAIHQFHGGSTAGGDAITNGLFYTRRLLRSMGFESNIYCEDIAPELVDEIKPAGMLPETPEVLLLLHFSWAIRHLDWLEQLRCRKVLVYHNITPAEFFLDPAFGSTSEEARRQLERCLGMVEAVIAMSRYSAAEVRCMGWTGPLDVIPLLVDPQELLQEAVDLDALATLDADESFKVLYVGRIVENKCQADLLYAIDRLRRLTTRGIRLILPGGLGAGSGYRDHILALRRELGLDGIVELPGRVRDAHLKALYRGCDVYLSLSEHEGFCVPIVEAMQFDLPVIALAAGAVRETVGSSGLLIDDKDPDLVAGLLHAVSEQPELRRRLALAGRRNVQRFASEATLAALSGFLRGRPDVAAFRPPATPAQRSRQVVWRWEGPFDSSYSLALVNRSIALQLSEDPGISVGMHSTEGPGDFAPRPEFIAENPVIERLWQQGKRAMRADVVVRNLYPPRVTGMHAPTRVLGGWAWEESGLPTDWVSQFNRTLNLITVPSNYVAKVLRNNGIRVPVAVVGNGTDHLSDVVAGQTGVSLADDTFRFLHISSALPRKGIDVLLAAWERAFTASDRVVLVIKTQSNPHNQTRKQIEALAARCPLHARIVHIEGELDAGQVAGLYESCHAFVAPSRGEGFGLPIAEAIHRGLAIVTTRHGGALDFCNDDNAWLVDYDFAYSTSHLELFDSAWAEPRVESLAQCLREVFTAPALERQRRTAAARAMLQQLSWANVAVRTQAALRDIEKVEVPEPLPAIAWVSTWNIRCGIASYARYLATAMPQGSFRVFASHADALLQCDEPNVLRCWRQGWDDDLAVLTSALFKAAPTAVVFQFNFGFFNIRAFGVLLDQLNDAGIATHIVLHSTADVPPPKPPISLRQIAGSLRRCTRLIAHSVMDLNRLKSMGIVDNVMLFPHGAFAIGHGGDGIPERLRQRLDVLERPGVRVIATFGYLLPNKGLPEFIAAAALLRRTHSNVHLLMLNARYPAPESDSEIEACRAAIGAVQGGYWIHLINDFLTEDEAHTLLQRADLIVYPYGKTDESASGAVRFGLASQRPVACTPLPIFDDVSRVVHTLSGTDRVSMATSLESLLSDKALLSSKAELQERWIREHDWRALSQRLYNVIASTVPRTDEASGILFRS